MSNNQKNADSNWDGAGVGAASLASMPILSHLRYELVDRPGYRKQIEDLIGQAIASKSLYTNPASRKYSEWANPLQKKMRLGDTILQSHAGFPLSTLFSEGPDFTTLSTGASGSPFAHAAVSTRSGRAIDPGKDSMTALPDAAIGEIRKAFSDLRKGKTPSLRQGWERLAEMRNLHGRPEGNRRFLLREATDAFESGVDRPNASVVFRNDLRAGANQKALENAIADIKSVGYSKTGATLAGLLRMLVPFRSSNSQRGGSGVGYGTFCSHGACSALGTMGNKIPSYWSVLPPDLAKVENQRLLGIGVNRAAMDSVKHLKGLSRMERMGEAARKTMTDTLRSGANTRRTFAAALIGLLGTAGAGLGAAVDSGVSPGKAEKPRP